MLDEAPLECLIQYESLLTGPSSPLEKFLHAGSYVGHDYHMDIIGTRFIREMKYDIAARYLKKVSDGYEDRLNTSEYMKFDPFEVKSPTKNIRRYKLKFVTRMLDYEYIVKNCTDPDVVGEARIRMGLGILSSFRYCWPLTHYSKSEYDPWYDEQYAQDMIAYAQSMIEKGLESLKSQELAARFYRDLYQWRTAVEKFPETKVAEEIRSSCDNIVNYR